LNLIRHYDVHSQSKKSSTLQKILGGIAAAAFIFLPLANSSATPRSNPQHEALKHRQKEERKQLMQQQKAMRRVMAQHEQTLESRQRFQHDMKMQRRMLRERQKEETRRLTGSRKAQKSRPSTP
jgi:hypothetical protein